MSSASSLIRLVHPSFGEGDVARLREVLDSGYLVQGRFVAAFEATLADRLGQAVAACSSGTAALHLAMLALGVGPGDEVIVPAFTWPATAAVVVQVGATPVFVDVDRDALAMIPEQVEGAITDRTRALIPVHLFGIPAPMVALMAIAERHGLVVVEDAACALGTDTPLGPAGTIGEVGCFSFHPRKSITTGEGGAVTTGSAAIEGRLRAFLNHGIVVEDGKPRFAYAGLNYRMSDIAGALGLGQAEGFSTILAERRRLGRRYLDQLAPLEASGHLRIPNGLADPGNSFQSLVVELPSEEARDAVLNGLRAAEIQCTIGTYAVTEQPFYQARFGVDPVTFPNAKRLMDRLVTLPLHHGMHDQDVARVVMVLGELCQGG